ncbi:MAG: DUF1841 family protein [Myxococcaceae bacterium]
MDYDPQRSPDAKAWLAQDEAARVKLCEAAHESPPEWHPPIKSPRLHAAVHAVVENQVALGQPPQTRAALERLMAQGLSRHEAVHEVGTVVSQLLLDLVQKKQPFNPTVYAEALDGLRRKIDPNLV